MSGKGVPWRVLAGAAAFAAVASASASISDPILLVTATNASGTGTFSVPLASATPLPGGGAMWVLPASVNIMNGPNVIASISAMSTIIRPQNGTLANLISVGFTFVAGGSDTTFTVDSAVFGFTPVGAAGRTSGAVGITDQNGNGAQFHGLGPAGGSFLTVYNGQAPGGTLFASILPLLIAADPGGSASANQAVPGGGLYLPIVPPVGSMSDEWHFILTANDSVGATSVWEIIPAPAGALALLGFGGLSMLRRARRS